METSAKSEARKRWRKKNPVLTIALSKADYDTFTKIAIDKNISRHGLVKNILLEWIKNNAS